MENEAVEEVKQNKRKGLSAFFNVLIVLGSIIALAIAGVLIYQKRYLSPFWVNGQSMYPTLNKNATHADGTLLGETGGSAEDGSTWIEYGVMDKHERAIKKLKRFDIVVCNYSSDDESDKIKRIIGMPGETIKFGHGEDKGQLYVKSEDTYTFVQQPLDNEYVAKGLYPEDEITLTDNQYYVLGDNRAHSSDSRANGPIEREWIIGKVVAIVAHCEVRLGENNTLEPFNIKHFPPRFL